MNFYAKFPTAVVALFLILLFMHAPARSEEWPVKKFEVFIGVPFSSSNENQESIASSTADWWEWDEAMTPSNPMSNQVKREVEAYLTEIATTLEQMGFKPPVIEPVLTINGEPTFRVYYFDYAGVSPARRRSDDCGRVRPTVQLNANKFLENGGIPPKSYQDLAHELFHGVQAGYPLFRANCGGGLGAWIGEGTAQAMGADLAAWSSRNVNYPNGSGDWIGHRWGLREYSAPLIEMQTTDVRKKSRAYGASSFWRYLAEYAASSGAAGTKAIKPDYSYLIQFFNSSLAGQRSEANDMAWLHGQLKAYGRIGLGLDRIYPNFSSTFAAYINTRTKPPGRTPAQNQDRWLAAMFTDNQCPEIRLNDNHPVTRAPLEIKAFASGCFRLSLAYSQPTDIQITVTEASRLSLEGLSIGTENGAVVAQPNMIELGGEWSATWIFNMQVSLEPSVFVITNMRDDPVDTLDLTAQIEFAPTSSKNNLAVYGPAPPPYGPQQPEAASPGPSTMSEPAPSPNQAPAQSSGEGEIITMESQSERVGEQIETGLQSLSPNMAHGNTMARHPKQAPCADAFKFVACGPHTSIGLDMVPGMYGSGVQNTGRGGIFGQFASMLSGAAAAGPENTGNEIREAAELADSFDGASVSIVIPLIDYGFTGSFSNASLRVSRKNRGQYKAVGPQDIEPGPGRMFPLSGRVTIEEYTPSLLRGSYSGNLVDMDRVNLTGDDESLPIHQTIEGSFQIVATWQGDERIAVQGAEDPVESVLKDVQEMIPGIDPQYMRDLMAAQGANPDLGGNDSGGKTVYIEPACDCSCNAPPQERQCLKVCAGTIAACAGLMATAVSAPPESARAKVEDERTQPFLRSMPNACDLLDEKTAGALLEAATVKPSGVREYYAKVTSQCAHRDAKAKGKRAELKMLFASLLMYDSRQNTVEELRMKVAGLRMSSEKPSVIDGLGNLSFGTNEGDTTSLVVLTGIYGTAMDSDTMTTELIATYNLTNPEKTPPERMMALIKLARPQIEALQRLSVTSHEGATGE